MTIQEMSNLEAKIAKITGKTPKEIGDILSEAQMDFWSQIAKSFPEITSGDFAPDCHMAFHAATVIAFYQWIRSNHPNS